MKRGRKDLEREIERNIAENKKEKKGKTKRRGARVPFLHAYGLNLSCLQERTGFDSPKICMYKLTHFSSTFLISSFNTFMHIAFGNHSSMY